uniref:Tox-PL-2 domain-containing protein n=1 Tax=Cyanothece sp. (strain PCC 7425 / ATCC 29141) TaxID=395961 RepID=B8HUB9_CYAP4
MDQIDQQELRQQITSIASRFGDFECEPCADAIEKFLRQQGISGKRIKLYTGSALGLYGNIFHDGLERNISTNGRHQGVIVELDGQEIVFDNIHHEGVERTKWLLNFHCSALDMGGSFHRTEITF